MRYATNLEAMTHDELCALFNDMHCLKCDHVWNEQASPDACPHCGNTDKEQTAYLTTP